MSLNLSIRRVIRGKAYDTDTAEFVAVIANHGTPFLDFEAEITGLYVTKKHQWFIAGTGGAASRWRKRAGDGKGWLPAEGLELVSSEDAQALLEQVDGPVEDYFDVEEG